MSDVLDYQATKVADLPKGVVAVKVSTDWCMPCKMLAKTFPGLQNAVLAQVNADEDSEFTDPKFGVRNVPTTLIFLDGELKEKVIGDRPTAIQEAIDLLN